MVDDGETDDSTRRTARRPITLAFEGRRLRLPDEEPEPASEPEVDVPSEPTPAPEAEDGWVRQRPSLTPPPMVAFRATEPAPPLSGPGALPSEGDALDLVQRRSRPPSATLDLAAEMRDRFDLGDYTGALSAAELLLGREAENAEAARIADESRGRLEQILGARLGPMSRRPEPAVEPSEVRWLGLDNRAAFLLSRADGHASFEDLVDVSGMSRLDALKTLVQLMDLGALQLAR